MSTVLDNYGSIVDKIFYMDNYDYNNGFIEFFTRAMHGEVIGYKYECGKILPIFEESEEELMNKINYKKYLDGVITFIKNTIDHTALLTVIVNRIFRCQGRVRRKCNTSYNYCTGKCKFCCFFSINGNSSHLSNPFNHNFLIK